MSDIAIRVDGLGKRYRIGGKQERYKTLRDTLTNTLAAPIRGLSSLARRDSENGQHAPKYEEIWALKDVSFEVKAGEAVGIIGRNGAGKSTLLKVLSRITEPTEGVVDIYGRVASLLEVGTGFHQELTGRENIYLNGAILGMRRAEIERKFDEIVAFAEIEKFIDTPVKHYSSGMYLRLAFAVAAHLEPEILLVDEVLAVGDASFQKKCLGKMQDVAEEGRTVLFVSHNIASLLELCSTGILFEQGHIVKQDPIESVSQAYFRLLQPAPASITNLRHAERPRNIPARAGCRLLSCRLTSQSRVQEFQFGEPVGFEITFETLRQQDTLELGIGVFVAGGFEICSILTSDYELWHDVTPGTYVVKVCLPGLQLMPGHFELGLGLRSHAGWQDYVKGGVCFEVLVSEKAAQRLTHYRRGLIIPEIKVELDALSSETETVGL